MSANFYTFDELKRLAETLSPAKLADVLLEAWRKADCGYFTHKADWDALFTQAEWFSPFTSPIWVCRGYREPEHQAGISWTTERHVAKRFTGPNGYIATGIVKPEDIINGNYWEDEAEILVFGDRVQILEVALITTQSK